MSIWAFAEGSLLYPKLTRLGAREVLGKILKDHECSNSVVLCDDYISDKYRKFKINIGICSDGVDAAEHFNAVFTELKALGAVQLDFNTNIRFLL